MNRLNILFIDFDDIRNPLLGAGQARATFEVGKILAQKGHIIRVLSCRYPGYKDRVEDGIYFKHIGIGTKHIRINNAFYILAVPFSRRFMKADIVIECFTAPITTLLAPLWTKVPVVAIPTSFEAERFSELYHLPFSFIQNNGLKFYKYFLPYSKFFDEKFKLFNSNIVSKIVPQGVNNDAFNIKKEKPEHILFLGRLDIDQKGIDLLLSAYKNASKEISYPLVIAGNGPDEAKIISLIKSLGLEKKVHLVGRATGVLKEKLLKKSAYIVIPSRHEGFCIWALEALAAGLPVICFDIPGLSWIPSKVAMKVKPFEVESFAKALVNASKTFTLRTEKLCKDVALKYSWGKVALKYETFFYSILRRENISKKSELKSYEN